MTSHRIRSTICLSLFLLMPIANSYANVVEYTLKANDGGELGKFAAKNGLNGTRGAKAKESLRQILAERLVVNLKEFMNKEGHGWLLPRSYIKNSASSLIRIGVKDDPLRRGGLVLKYSVGMAANDQMNFDGPSPHPVDCDLTNHTLGPEGAAKAIGECISMAMAPMWGDLNESMHNRNWNARNPSDRIALRPIETTAVVELVKWFADQIQSSQVEWTTDESGERRVLVRYACWDGQDMKLKHRFLMDILVESSSGGGGIIIGQPVEVAECKNDQMDLVLATRAYHQGSARLFSDRQPIYCHSEPLTFPGGQNLEVVRGRVSRCTILYLWSDDRKFGRH